MDPIAFIEKIFKIPKVQEAGAFKIKAPDSF